MWTKAQKLCITYDEKPWAGGEVSEESQGLDGAREMFQTSQRLGEVI